MTSLTDELATKGYLTVNKLVIYLRQYPIRAASYPTIKRMVDRGEILSEIVGKQQRITKAEIDRYISDGPRTAKTVGDGGASAPPEPHKLKDGLPAWLGREPPDVSHLVKKPRKPA